MIMSKIEWLHVPGYIARTWNPITGCSKVSEGCQNCYAERMAKRLQSNPLTAKKYSNGFAPTFHPENLHDPEKWKKPSVIFVCSMGDLFYYNDKYLISQSITNKIYWEMYCNDRHKYLCLTKRPDNALNFYINTQCKKNYHFLQNVGLGVTVELQKYAHRIETLIKIPAAMRFVSLEPLLGPIDLSLYLDCIDWVIVGGESGPSARKMDANWVIDIYEQCRTANVPMFFKQWGGVNKKKTGHSICGVEIREFPEWSLK